MNTLSFCTSNVECTTKSQLLCISRGRNYDITSQQLQQT